MNNRFRKNESRKKRSFRNNLAFIIVLFLPTLLGELALSGYTYQFPIFSFCLVIGFIFWIYKDLKKDLDQSLKNDDLYVEYDKELNSLMINNGKKEFQVPVENIKQFGTKNDNNEGFNYVILLKKETPFGRKIKFIPDENTKEGKILKYWIKREIANQNFIKRNKR